MIGLLRDMWEDGWPGRALLGFLIVVVALVALLIWAVIKESNEWEAFKVKHNCKVVSYSKGSPQIGVGYGTTSGGKGGTVVVVTQQPDKTGWQCDDGVTYYR